MRLGILLILAWILILCLSQVPVQSQYYSHTLPYDPKPLKLTNLHFFYHETFAGKDPTTVLVAQPNITSNNNNSSSSFRFGSVAAIDDPLKIGPEDNSEVIGNAQGIAVVGDKNGTILVSYWDFGFISGKFNGSSISIFSRNLIAETERELAVVGGRGKFRMAKGFAKLKTYLLNATNLIVEYNVTVIHQEDEDDDN